MSDTTPEEIARLRELASKATQGEWICSPGGEEDAASIWVNDHPYHPATIAEEMLEADATYIVAMHKALPGLLDEVEILRQTNKTQSEQVLLMRGMLRAMQWTEHWNGLEPFCEWCKSTMSQGHTDDCVLAKALQGGAVNESVG